MSFFGFLESDGRTTDRPDSNLGLHGHGFGPVGSCVKDPMQDFNVSKNFKRDFLQRQYMGFLASGKSQLQLIIQVIQTNIYSVGMFSAFSAFLCKTLKIKRIVYLYS